MEVNSRPAPPASPRAFFVSVAVFGVVACAVIGVLFQGILQTPIDTDEALYLNTGTAVERWLAADVADLMPRTRSTLTIAPLAPLLGGVSRLLAGLPFGGPYLFPAGSADPLATAIMPAPELLLTARLPMVMAGIASTALLAALMWRARGPATGIAAAAMLIANVTYTTFNQRLLNEAPLLLCTALAYIAARRASRGTGIGVCVAAGVLAGLAIVAKHTGVLTVAAAVGLVGLADLAKRLRMRTVIARAATLVSAAGFVAIALNPFVWTNPLTAIGDVIAARVVETNEQRGFFPTTVLSTPLERVNGFTWRVFTNGATLGCAQSFDRGVAVDPITNQWRFGAFVPGKLLAKTPLCQPELAATPVMRPLTVFNLAWFVAGICVAMLGAKRDRRRIAGVALGWGGLFMGATVALVQFSWFHYYALPLVFATLIQAVAIGAGAQKLIELARRRAGRVGQP